MGGPKISNTPNLAEIAKLSEAPKTAETSTAETRVDSAETTGTDGADKEVHKDGFESLEQANLAKKWGSKWKDKVFNKGTSKPGGGLDEPGDKAKVKVDPKKPGTTDPTNQPDVPVTTDSSTTTDPKATTDSSTTTDPTTTTGTGDGTATTGVGDAKIEELAAKATLADLQWAIGDKPDLNADPISFTVKVGEPGPNQREFRISSGGPMTDVEVKSLAENVAKTTVCLQHAGVSSFGKATFKPDGALLLDRPMLNPKMPLGEQLAKLQGEDTSPVLNSVSLNADGTVGFELNGELNTVPVKENQLRAVGGWAKEDRVVASLSEVITDYVKRACVRGQEVEVDGSGNASVVEIPVKPDAKPEDVPTSDASTSTNDVPGDDVSVVMTEVTDDSSADTPAANTGGTGSDVSPSTGATSDAPSGVSETGLEDVDPRLAANLSLGTVAVDNTHAKTNLERACVELEKALAADPVDVGAVSEHLAVAFDCTEAEVVRHALTAARERVRGLPLTGLDLGSQPLNQDHDSMRERARADREQNIQRVAAKEAYLLLTAAREISREAVDEQLKNALGPFEDGDDAEHFENLVQFADIYRAGTVHLGAANTEYGMELAALKRSEADPRSLPDTSIA